MPRWSTTVRCPRTSPSGTSSCWTPCWPPAASAAITFLKGYGCKHIKLMNILAAPEGIACIQKDHPDVDIYVAAVDEKLNEHAYIVPGLGDAGDRIFGTK